MFLFSDDEDETLIPQLKWPNFEENMYCDDELNDDDDNPLRLRFLKYYEHSFTAVVLSDFGIFITIGRR